MPFFLTESAVFSLLSGVWATGRATSPLARSEPLRCRLLGVWASPFCAGARGGVRDLLVFRTGWGVWLPLPAIGGAIWKSGYMYYKRRKTDFK